MNDATYIVIVAREELDAPCVVLVTDNRLRAITTADNAWSKRTPVAVWVLAPGEEPYPIHERKGEMY